jgi:TonB-dependent starch-binding outer membrane protein SusC
MKKTVFLALFALFLVTQVVAQTRVLRGKVTSSEDQQGIPGVNIVILNTSKGTATDEVGNYSIEIAPGENIIVFSFIGYKTQTAEIGSREVIDIQLAPDEVALEEVVVVGYGIQKKSDVTGSTATISGDQLVKQPVLTATQALQGQVAGVQIISSGQPGRSPQIRLRGLSTALAGTTSLYVVDGILTDDITNINTADIVDINILKDASAAAIYGSRGANGVIIVTTKKGKAGGLQINYNNNIGIRQASNLVEMANAEEYRNYVQAATGSAPPPSSYDTDWYNTILRTAWQQTHNISVSTGTDKSTYLFNVGYLQDQGIVLENEFKRFTLRFNSDHQITNHVKFGFQSSYGNSVNENGFGNLNIDAYGNIGSVYNDTYRAAPIIADKVGDLYGNTSTYQNVGNPLLDINNNSIKVKENRLQGSTFLEVKPLEWLTLRSSIGGDWRNSLNRAYYYKFANDETTFLIAGGNQYNTQSSLSVAQTQSFRWVWDNTFTINKSFGKHAITLLAGTTAEKFKDHFFSASRKDVPADPSLWYIGVGDANTSQNDGGGDAWSRNSYLARLNYSYNERYLLTATVRRDGSSRLPSKNRWQTYPSVGLGWIISREGFMQNQNIFDLLKLRASYGKVGNDQIPTNAFSQTVAQNKPYPYSGISTGSTNGVQINQVIDPDITWETTEEYDLAVEFGVFQSKLTGEVNYYKKTVDNALIFKPLLVTWGYDLDHVILTNAASIRNTGVEIALNWKDNITDNLSYTISGNVTFNDNQVTALNGGLPIYSGGIGAAQGFVTFTDIGEQIGSFHVLKVIGVFNSSAEVAAYQDEDGNMIQPGANPGDFKYKDKNKDGKIDDNDRVFAGSYQPVAYFGLNLGVNFKNWDFSLSLYGNVGNEIYNGKKAVRIAGTDNVEKDVVYNRWTVGNKSQSEPAANSGNLPGSTYFVESGSFLRINNFTVGYRFPEPLLKRLRISSFRVFATSQNLLTLKKYSGFTPELPGDPVSSGIELTSYPTTRTIAVGLNLGF